jgi:hypothetical protein
MRIGADRTSPGGAKIFSDGMSIPAIVIRRYR